MDNEEDYELDLDLDFNPVSTTTTTKITTNNNNSNNNGNNNNTALNTSTNRTNSNRNNISNKPNNSTQDNSKSKVKPPVVFNFNKRFNNEDSLDNNNNSNNRDNNNNDSSKKTTQQTQIPSPRQQQFQQQPPKTPSPPPKQHYKLNTSPNTYINNLEENSTKKLKSDITKPIRQDNSSNDNNIDNDNSSNSNNSGVNFQQQKQQQQKQNQMNERKLPGPAGLLPPRMPGENMNSKKIMKFSDNGISNQSLFIKNKGNSFNDDINQDFTKGPWIQMLKDRQLPPFKNNDNKNLLKYNIDFVLNEGFLKKVPYLIVYIRSLTGSDSDFQVVVSDPSGEMKGTIQKKILIEIYPEMSVGSVLVLTKVSIFSPTPKSHYINIVLSNIEYVYYNPVMAISKDSQQKLLNDTKEFDEMIIKHYGGQISNYNPMSIYQDIPKRSEEEIQKELNEKREKKLNKQQQQQQQLQQLDSPQKKKSATSLASKKSPLLKPVQKKPPSSNKSKQTLNNLDSDQDNNSSNNSNNTISNKNLATPTKSSIVNNSNNITPTKSFPKPAPKSNVSLNQPSTLLATKSASSTPSSLSSPQPSITEYFEPTVNKTQTSSPQTPTNKSNSNNIGTNKKEIQISVLDDNSDSQSPPKDKDAPLFNSIDDSIGDIDFQIDELEFENINSTNNGNHTSNNNNNNNNNSINKNNKSSSNNSLIIDEDFDIDISQEDILQIEETTKKVLVKDYDSYQQPVFGSKINYSSNKTVTTSTTNTTTTSTKPKSLLK